jgi:hypothetical protein
MRDSKRIDVEPVTDAERVPLSQAGISKADIEAQLEKLQRSEEFESKTKEKQLLAYLVRGSLDGNPQRLRASVIGEAVFPTDNDPAGRTRKEVGKLRDTLDAHYATANDAATQIRFSIPLGQYAVYSPRAVGRPLPDAPEEEPQVVAVILDPPDGAEVHHRVVFRGRIEGLEWDFRVWLLLTLPSGYHYPQCRVSRNRPDWQQEARVGRVAWASDEGIVFEMHLVAAGDDADFAFYEYLKSGRDGFGRVLPSDSRILHTKHYVRRDIRPGP